MFRFAPFASLAGLALTLLALACQSPTTASTAVTDSADTAAAIARASVGAHRSAANIARNPARHPVETLGFFGLEPDMTVLEVLPGGMWYTEVIAPVVRDEGHYIAASYDVSQPDLPDYMTRAHANLVSRFENEAFVLGDAEIVTLGASKIDLGPDERVDLVVTFRSTHGMIRNGLAEDAYAAFYDVLKPGGVLGVVQHRAGPRTDLAAFTGYVSQERLIEIAERAGFELEATSEVNANPRDTADHPKGVWTLPPSFRMGDEDRAKYAAIGESDRMTLRFRKPRS